MKFIPRRLWLVLAGMLSLITMTHADDSASKTLKVDFAANSKDYVLTPSFATASENPDKKGEMQLKIDTRLSETAWNMCFKTAPGVLKPDTDYVVQAKCEILEAGADSYLYSMIRPYDANNAYSDIAQAINARVGASEKIYLKFHVPANIPNYSLQIHTSKKVLALVDDVTISECAPEKQQSLAENFSPADLPKQLPTGADDFTVELPHSNNSQVESVTQYGADVNSPDNSKSFNDAIAHCAATGASKLIVPKGIYHFTSDNPIHFEKLTDFEFDGQGSTFVFLKKKNNLVEVLKSEKILLKNFSIDWDWEQAPLASVVRVETAEPSGKYADFRFVDYQKFPKKDIRIATLDELDPKTLSPGCENYAGILLEVFAGRSHAPKIEWLGDNLLRVYSESGSFKGLVPGTFFRMKHYYYDMPAIFMENNTNLTLSGVNIYSAPGMGLVVGGDQNHWQFLNTNIVRPPGTTRPITCTADHFHVSQSGGFFKMEGCEISWGGDDAINIHDCSGFGYKTGPFTISTINLSQANTYHIGDPIELRRDDYSPTGFTSKIKSINTVDRQKRAYEFILEDPVPEQTTSGFILFNRRYGSREIVIRNCYFHDCPRILLLASNVTFEKNRMVHGMATALKIESGYTLNTWSEGYGASNIVIRDNVFDNVNLMGKYPNERQPVIYMSVYLKSDPSSQRTTYPILSNVLIEGNTFHTFPGAVAYVCSAQNVIIRNNTIGDETPRQKNYDYKGSIVLAYDSDIFVTGNTWNESSYMPSPSLIIDSETSKDIHSWNNHLVPDTKPSAPNKP